MDEVFWSNVVKRWAEASETVIRIRKELENVQEERDRYRKVIEQLRKADHDIEGRRQSPSLVSVRRSQATEKDLRSVAIQNDSKLQNAEAALGKAKEEYRRLQQELAFSAEQIRTLKLENEKLLLDNKQEMINIQNQLSNKKDGQSNNVKALESLHSENSDPIKDLIQGDRRGKTYSSKSHFDLEQKIESLSNAMKARNLENQHLLKELQLTQEKLQKAEENAKVLLASIIKLQNMINRQSAPVVSRPITDHPSLLLNHLQPLEKVLNSRASVGNFRDSDADLAERVQLVDGSYPIHFDEETMVAGTIPHSFLPPNRGEAIAKLPTTSFHADGLIKTSDNIFSRDFLKVALREGAQHLKQYIPEKEAIKGDISSYLCPTLNHNPWCPSNPGQHGFLFVGLGTEKGSYKSISTRHLFVGLPKTEARIRNFRYLGRYRVNRVQPLSVEEWNTLSDDVKLMYSKLTKNKNQDPRPVESIKLSYDQGDLRVPCILLECISFDYLLYSALKIYRSKV